MDWEAIRYVDNRLCICRAIDRPVLARIAMFDPEFYGAPVVLERESGLQYVGFEIIPDGPTFECAYPVPGFEMIEPALRCNQSGPLSAPLGEEQWRYRSPRAGGLQ